MLPLAQVIKKHNTKYHNYADDSQLYLSLSLDDLHPIHSLTQCINNINLWMSQNFLQLNKDKTDINYAENKQDFDLQEPGHNFINKAYTMLTFSQFEPNTWFTKTQYFKKGTLYTTVH